MASGKVIVSNRFREYGRELDRQIIRSLGQAAGVTIATAKSVPSRYNIGSIRAKISVDGPVHRTVRGYEVTVRDKDWRSNFFESGTYQKLGRRLTARSKAGAEGNRGIRPSRYMRKGKTAGRRALIELLNRNVG